MIVGIGTDIVRVARIESALKRFGDRFITRCFTGAEIRHGDNPRKLAKRFAAKEACAKALGSGIAGGILFKEIEVVNDDHGAPSLILHGNALKKLAHRTLDKANPRLHLTLSDERDQALAVVVIEAE